jgi:DNA-binding NtrC family response regulator
MTIKDKSILIIDDDAAMLRALHKVLSGEGAVVADASWGGEVMEQLDEKKGCFDLIITDLRMPVLNGQSILGAVKTALPQIPVIVITAFGTPEAKAECLHKGASAFLEKPVNSAELLKAVKAALSQKKPKFSRWALRLKRAKRPSATASDAESDFFRQQRNVYEYDNNK